MPIPDGLVAALFSHYGPRGWWPLLKKKNEAQGWHCVYRPGDYGASLQPLQRFEIGIGAVLTQNTSWNGAVKALISLKEADRLRPERLIEPNAVEEIRQLVRPSGFFNQKQERLAIWSYFFMQQNGHTPHRSVLLALKGIGPETADSILLYAYGRPLFIADAYARRIMGRITGVAWSYESLAGEMHRMSQTLVESERLQTFNEAHALMVEHGKQICQVRPLCGKCFLNNICYKGMQNGKHLS